jgi:uncharacterized LabA/DUF88 family protein
MTRVVAYVDGFNLYHGLKAVYGRRYHWLDLQALVRSLLRPGQELLEVQYFTARVRDNPAAESRQALYLEALMSHSIRVRLIEGHFQDKPRECRNCGAHWMAYEEKEADVNIAIAMLTDAVQDAYDTAILVSGDSDLRPVIASVSICVQGSGSLPRFRHGDTRRTWRKRLMAMSPSATTSSAMLSSRQKLSQRAG